jgi:DMSO reductase family type II enzyme molybdopterin subunit
MNKIDRRGFLKTVGITGVSILNAENVWSLTSLQPIENTLTTDYAYRGWEDIYRKEYEHDVVGYAAHCVNCHGNCAFKILAKDGIVMREEQLAQYPQIADHVPDTNPRGCQKGAINSQAMYESDRIRYPMKRAGERGEGKWQRISWDRATTEIADKIIDLYEAHGPGCLATHVGTGTVSNGKLAAGLRFASLMGGVQEDALTDVGDGQSGQYLALGDNMENATSDAWFDADYLLLSFLNVNATRIPDAHYVWEAKYNGSRVVTVSPDYNPTAIHADRWLNIKPGADPFLYMSMVYTILEENLIDRAFIQEQTDLILLVRQDNGKLLRESDLEDGGSSEVFYLWDTRTETAKKANGSMGSKNKTLALGNYEPALEGLFDVQGVAVQPAFVHMRKEVMKFSPEMTAEKTGLHPDIVRDEARRFATAKKAVVAAGFASAKLLNGIYIQWAQILMCALTGHSGERGGYWSPFSFWGFETAFFLGFLQTGKTPRFECGGLGEFVHGKKIIEARQHYDNEKLKSRVGFDVEEMQHMIDESIETKQMPVYEGLKGGILMGDNKFSRNKGPHYRERILDLYSELFVNINIRMDSTAMFADYVLPAAGHYEGWDYRTTPLHRFGNLFTAPVKPVGESKPEWDMFVLLTKKIQERAITRNISPYPDGSVTRDLNSIHDDYTMGGMLMEAKDEVRFLIENNPQHQGQTFEQGVEQGFLPMWQSPSPATAKVQADQPVHPWRLQLEDKVPYPTLSGRITFYCDHDWYLALNSSVPTARDNAGPESSQFPYTFYTPHTRWGIHSTWRSNKYMMRQQRGEPNVYISPGMAEAKGIKDGEQVRVFNGIGEFFAQAKVTPTVRSNQVMMEHGWEPYQMKERKGLNHVIATLIQPLELVGNWGHLKFNMYKWNPNQLSNESGVDIERAEQT